MDKLAGTGGRISGVRCLLLTASFEFDDSEELSKRNVAY
jgi:hypothetical protein